MKRTGPNIAATMSIRADHSSSKSAVRPMIRQIRQMGIVRRRCGMSKSGSIRLLYTARAPRNVTFDVRGG